MVILSEVPRIDARTDCASMVQSQGTVGVFTVQVITDTALSSENDGLSSHMEPSLSRTSRRSISNLPDRLGIAWKSPFGQFPPSWKTPLRCRS